jgi:hypothetical protein
MYQVSGSITDADAVRLEGAMVRASGPGQAHREVPLGMGEDTSRLVGATAAAISSITDAPTEALRRKVVGWFR